MKVSAVITSVMALAVATSAKADWQYTRWGMSPAQVIAASKGKVGSFDPSKDATMPFGVKEAFGTYTSNGRQLKASFWFKQKKLTQIDLSSDNQDECFSLRRDLSSIYGNGEVRPGGMITSSVWNDRAKGNRIQFIDWGSQGCNLIYSSLATSRATGL